MSRARFSTSIGSETFSTRTRKEPRPALASMVLSGRSAGKPRRGLPDHLFLGLLAVDVGNAGSAGHFAEDQGGLRVAGLCTAQPCVKRVEKGRLHHEARQLVALRHVVDGLLHAWRGCGHDTRNRRPARRSAGGRLQSRLESPSRRTSWARSVWSMVRTSQPTVVLSGLDGNEGGRNIGGLALARALVQHCGRCSGREGLGEAGIQGCRASDRSDRHQALETIAVSAAHWHRRCDRTADSRRQGCGPARRGRHAWRSLRRRCFFNWRTLAER